MQGWHRGVFIAFYLVFLAWVTFHQLNAGLPGSSKLLPAIYGLVLVTMLPLVFYRPTFGWFHPLVFGATLSTIDILRRGPMYAFGLRQHKALPDFGVEGLNELVAMEAAVNTLGLLAWYLGYAIAVSPRIPRLHFAKPRNLRFKAMALVALGMAAFAVYAESRGGLAGHLASWGGGRHRALAGDYYFITLARLGTPATLVWLALDMRALRRPTFWVAAATALSIHFLTAGSRGELVYSVAIGISIWMMRSRRIAYTWVLALGLTGILALNVLGALRRSTWSGGELDFGVLTDFDVSEAIEGTAGGELTKRVTESGGGLPVLARVPEQVDYIYGQTYLAVLTIPIPRRLWEGKPGLVDGLVGRTFFGLDAGIPPGPAVEAYWNLSYVGILLVFLLFGIFHRWLVRILFAYPGVPAVTLLYVLVLFLYRSPSSTGFVSASIALAPALGILWLFGTLRLRRPRRMAAPGGRLGPMAALPRPPAR